MKRYFVINPVSGNGRAREFVAKLKESDYGLVYITAGKGDAERFIKQEAESGEKCVFYAVGGDGTLNETVNGAAGLKNVSIGVIPAGTGNDFVRYFENRDKFLDIDAQLNGEEIQIDAIKAVFDGVKSVFFINMANIGFDCNVVINASKIKNGIISGPMAYIMGAVQEIFRKWGQDVKIIFDDGYEYNGCQLLCTIANAGYCGGGFNSSPFADISDGYIDAAIIDKISRPKLISMLKGYREGTYLNDPKAKDFITYRRAKSLTAEFSSNTEISVDGEIFEFKRADFTVHKGCLNFIVPKGAYIPGGLK